MKQMSLFSSSLMKFQLYLHGKCFFFLQAFLPAYVTLSYNKLVPSIRLYFKGKVRQYEKSREIAKWVLLIKAQLGLRLKS